MAAGETTVPHAVQQLSKHKVKVKKAGQRACNEKDEKGKFCGGHLKRWFDYQTEVRRVVGKDAEIYRCEFCKTIYRPDPKQQPNSYTVRY